MMTCTAHGSESRVDAKTGNRYTESRTARYRAARDTVAHGAHEPRRASHDSVA